MNARTEPHVLHVRSSAGMYGAEYVVLGLAPALAAQGIGSTVLCLENYLLGRQPLHDAARDRGVACDLLPCRGRFDLGTVRALRRHLDAHERPLLHVHDYKSAFHAWLARGRRDVPIVATSHGLFATDRALRLYERIEAWLARRATYVCLVADAMRATYERAGVAPERIVTVANGIDTDRFRPGIAPASRAELGLDAGDFVFGATMRLTEQKNPLLLVDAFADVLRELPHAALVVAGDGPLRDAMLMRAATLGVAPRLRLPGARGDVEHLYAMFDCFVLPSLYEGLPLALLEAMASERPVVATAVGQVPDVLAGTGVAPVPPGDRAAFAQAMLRAAREPQPVAALRARVVDRHSVARMAAEYATIYRESWSGHERIAA
jgi:L-malate glycosyltransferase